MSDPFNQVLGVIGVTICEADLGGKLGCYDETTATITIAPEQEHIGKYVTFIHEALHAVDTQMREAGIVKRRAPHSFIENCSMNLFLLMALGGFINGVTPDEAIAFAQQERE